MKFVITVCMLSLLVASANAGVIPVQSIGVDFANGPSTSGAGLETNFNLIEADGAIADGSVIDSDGNILTGVSITTTGILDVMGNNNLGYGAAGAGDYNTTPFSDLSFHDGVYQNGAVGSIILTLTGLDDNLTYNVLSIHAGGINKPNQTVTLNVNGATDTGSYEDVRGTQAVPIPLNPLEVTGATTDGSGNLVIDLSCTSYFGANALYVTAVPEPTTLGLLGLGAISLLRRRRR